MTVEPFPEWEPHAFWPDYQAMGDCITCGNIRQTCERENAAYAVAAAIANFFQKAPSDG